MRRPAGDPQQVAPARHLDESWRPVAGVEGRVDPFEDYDRPHRLVADALLDLEQATLEIGPYPRRPRLSSPPPGPPGGYARRRLRAAAARGRPAASGSSCAEPPVPLRDRTRRTPRRAPG